MTAYPAPPPASLSLSHAQERLWFLANLEPDSAAFHIPVSVRLTGPLDTGFLEHAVNAVVERHDILRTTFQRVDGRPVLVVAPALTVTTTRVNLRTTPLAERAEEVQRLAAAEARRLFDLRRGPLIRSTLLRLGEAEHVWLVTMHHIISDADSFAIFFREVSAFYAAASAGVPPGLDDLSVQYGEFATWQREHLESGALQGQLAYWKRHLGGELPVLQLPTDRPRPEIQTDAGSTESLVTDTGLSARLKRLAKRERSTLFMTVLAVFKVLLHRYTNQTDLLVGSPTAGRNRLEAEGLIGYFQNTLVMRTDLSGDPTFRELLGRIRGVALDAYDHQDLPFAKLVEELHPVRDRGRNPLFQTMFLFQGAPMAAAWRTTLQLPGVTPAPLVVDTRTARLDLTLGVEDLGDELGVMVEYNTDLFDAATASRMLHNYHTCLEGVLADPDRPVSTLPVVSPCERRALLTRWQGPDLVDEETAPRCLHQAFQVQAAKSPDAVALVFRERCHSYRELDEASDGLAHHLRELGVGLGVLVGVFLERSPDLVIGLLGILKAGGAYLPMDPTYPAPRLEFMMDDANLPLVLTESGLLERLPRNGAAVLCMDARPVTEGAAASEIPHAETTPADLAYVIYTSGSTGTPKGVAITHGNLMNFLRAMAGALGMGANDVLLAVTTLSFDIAGLELYLPLVTGARIVLVEREVAADGRTLAAALGACGATVMQATPATWRLLVDCGWEGDGKLKILCGGEALPGELAARLLALGGLLYNLYGPTETTIWSTLERVEQLEDPVSIGRPIRNT